MERAVPRLPQRVAACIAAALPLLGLLGLLRRFRCGVGVRDNPHYGMQFFVEKTLHTGPTVLFSAGFDGFSLLLALLCAGWALAAVLGGALGSARPRLGWLLLLIAAPLGALASLDVLPLGLFYWAWLLALSRLLGLGVRPVLALLGPLLLGAAAVAYMWAGSVPAKLGDGTLVSHPTGLIELSYFNYFGELTLWGRPVAHLCFWALLLAAAAPLLTLAYVGLRRAAGLALLLSVPALALGSYVVLRLGGGLLPDSFVVAAPTVAALSVAALVAAAWGSWRAGELAQLLFWGLLGRAAAIFFALASLTQTGIQAALVQLVQHALGATLLGILLSVPQPLRGRRYGLALRVAVLVGLDLPGTLGFVGRTLGVLGTLPGYRVATVVALAALMALPVAALRALLGLGLRPQRGRDVGAAPLAVCAGLTLLLVGLGLWPQPLFAITHAWVNDFLSHTSGHLGAASFALR